VTQCSTWINFTKHKKAALFSILVFPFHFRVLRLSRFLEAILQSLYVHLTFHEPDEFSNKVTFSPIQGSILGSRDYAAILSSATSSLRDEK
jgi:hypothetical protein